MKPRGKKLYHTDTHRTCYVCRDLIDINNFVKRTDGTYYSACKDCNKIYYQLRRGRVKSAGGKYTKKEWNTLVSKYDSCPMCNRKWNEIPILEGRKSVITIDHIKPVSKGGSNNIDNLQPLCYSCNSKKGNKY